jgi:hypothetical protein
MFKRGESVVLTLLFKFDTRLCLIFAAAVSHIVLTRTSIWNNFTPIDFAFFLQRPNQRNKQHVFLQGSSVKLKMEVLLS